MDVYLDPGSSTKQMAKSSTKEADTGYSIPNQSEKDVKSKIVKFLNHFRIRQDRDIKVKL